MFGHGPWRKAGGRQQRAPSAVPVDAVEGVYEMDRLHVWDRLWEHMLMEIDWVIRTQRHRADIIRRLLHVASQALLYR